jgi:muramoyltetrapeptide carboxypeptidase
MNRRNFINSSFMSVLGLSLLDNSLLGQESMLSKPNIIKPNSLMPNDLVGVIAPGTAVSDPDDINTAKEAIEYFGLKMKLGDYVINGKGYKSRTVEERLIDLHNMFRNPEVKAIITIRGGYGSPQLLDGIDYKLIKDNPKIFMGYSDITAMLIAINKMTDMVTFHGPVLLSAFSDYTISNFKKAVFRKEPIGLTTNAKDKNTFREVFPIRTVRGGKAAGQLIGGNMSMICGTLGTPYEIETKDKLLFIEDVGEQPYRIDRMLTQLRLAGKLQSAKGIIVGYCKGCDYDVLQPSRIWDYSLGEIVDNLLGNLGIPVIYGLTIGHTSNQLTLPIGVNAELDADAKTLNIIESGVV